MHIAFIPYGHKFWVDRFLNEVQAQKYTMEVKSPNGEIRNIWMDGQLRILPFGIYEHVFPKEHRDAVLTALKCHRKNNYLEKQGGAVTKYALKKMRKALNLQEIPDDIDTKKSIIWTTNFVSILPIGIREDGELTEAEGEFKGWTHEGI